MNPTNKFWWFAVFSIAITILFISTLAIFSWLQLAPDQKAVLLAIGREQAIYIFVILILLAAVIGFGLDAIFHAYILPIARISEEISIISTANPSHRVAMEGGVVILDLARAVNEIAERREDLEKNLGEKIRLARKEVESEKNTLAAFMSELPEGVLICNSEGKIIMYNKRAMEFFGDRAGGEVAREGAGGDKAFIGLGRSIYSVVGEDLIHHALDELADKLARKEENVASYFVVVGKDANLLRAEAVPILNSRQEFSGFIVIFFDITAQIQTDSETAVVLQNLTTRFRASLASIRSTIELILEYPGIDPDKLSQLRKIILKETVEMGRLIDQSSGSPGSDIQTTRWPLTPMLAADLAASLRKKARDRLGVRLDVRETGDESLIKVDGYSMTMAMLFVLNQLKAVTGQDAFACEFESVGRLLSIDLIWRGDPVKIETLRQWDKQNINVEKEGISLSLKHVMRRHEAEIWSYQSDVSEGASCLRLYLPVIQLSDEVDSRNIMVLPESRPEFYDFDLFNQPGQNPTLDNRLLTELTYTVFDTETTGLDPRGGDEIISIAAVRIVNSRLLREEQFDQLIDPRRSLPPESTKIHGITPEMLEGQPFIEDVLPRFFRFVEDTILVAHNAAFDMRMLQMKEEATGVRFINPVLDTLLLSAVVNPVHKDHNIEGVTKRFGLDVVGRHTALGDAVTTGEMLLKLIPLLAEKGVTTLKQAREASQKTYYARLKY